MENEKITFEQMCDPAFRRAQQIKIKSEATWVAFLELDGLINKSKLAEQYFNKSQAWLSQKINGTVSHGARQRFSPADYHQLAEAFRHIARRLEQHAAEIDAASIDEE